MHRNARLTARCLAYASSYMVQTNNNSTVHVLRTFSTATTSNSVKTGATAAAAPPSLDGARETILESALEQVHEHGWTQEAISQAVLSSNFPLSMMGIVTPTDIITHFMEHCQERFQKDLDTHFIPQWKEEQAQDADVLSDRLESVVKARLEYVLPFVKSNKWHEGMALGATSNTTTTASQLDCMVQSIADAIIVGTHHAPLGIIERTAIGALYVSTELHLLTDESENKEATWAFLKSRIAEMQFLAESTADWNSVVANGDAAVAASAVASSLGGAVISLLQPAARGAVSAAASTVLPHLATFLQPSPQQSSGDGTRASDYNVCTEEKSRETTVTGNN